MISKDTIKDLANLSRLDLSEAEIESLTPEVDSILGYVSHIESMPVLSAATSPRQKNILRADVVANTSGEYTEAILVNAPQREKNYLKVKKILS